jgi:choice-of-anchor C domain-containing protein
MSAIKSIILSRLLPITGVALFAGFSPAYANLLVNGNFSEPGTGCESGTKTLPGWTVVAGNIDIESASCSGIGGKSETYFLDLTGSQTNDVGAISQTFKTVAHQKYNLTFYFGGNPQWQSLPYANDSALKAMTVYVNGAIAGVYSVQTAGVSTTNAQWSYHTITFTASTTTTTITFQSLNGSATNPSVFGPLLDDVSVNATSN